MHLVQSVCSVPSSWGGGKARCRQVMHFVVCLTSAKRFMKRSKGYQLGQRGWEQELEAVKFVFNHDTFSGVVWLIVNVFFWSHYPRNWSYFTNITRLLWPDFNFHDKHCFQKSPAPRLVPTCGGQRTLCFLLFAFTFIVWWTKCAHAAPLQNPHASAQLFYCYWQQQANGVGSRYHCLKLRLFVNFIRHKGKISRVGSCGLCCL